ncbi:MAG: hypothetical protein Q4F84_06570 [Fibrobacter sp.]|nr:hypothetical protein [Fibrobacter sp.]
MKSIWQLCLIAELCVFSGSFAESENNLSPEPAKLLIENDSVQQNKVTTAKNDTLEKQSVTVLPVNDTLQKQNTASLTENDTLQTKNESVTTRDTLKEPATVSQEESESLEKEHGRKDKSDETKKLKLTKHEYGKRNRIGLAIGMMAFLAVIMTTSQQWNPD